MVNRILWSAALTLALTFSPNFAFSTPTKTVKKKSSKSQEKIAKKSKSSKSSHAKKSRSHASRRTYRERDDVVESSMVPSYPERRTVTETPPLMKVTPQRDGRFLLEPLTPKKTLNTPLSQPPKPEDKNDRVSSNPPKYNTSEPWNFSELVLTQAKYYEDTPYARGGSLESSSATDCSGFRPVHLSWVSNRPAPLQWRTGPSGQGRDSSNGFFQTAARGFALLQPGRPGGTCRHLPG